MARFEITSPDGQRYEITAPDGATENDAIAYAQQQFGGDQGADRSVGDFASPEPLTAPRSATWMDRAKQFGAGAVEGVLATGSMPGNIELLGRMGIDKAATKLGFEDPGLSEPSEAKGGRRSFLPSYSDYKADLERRVGELPEENRADRVGRYARTIGQFLPMAIGRGGFVERGTRVAAPAVTSEAAGQLTEGTWAEPYARVAGAVAGSFAPAMGMRAITPNPVNPERARQVATLDAEGVTATTAGQRTGRRPLMWTESVTQDTPFAGRRAAQMIDAQGEQFTRAVLRRGGIDAPRATSEVIDDAFTRIGQQFDNLALNNTMRIDQRFAHDIGRTVQEYFRLVNQNARAPIVEETVRDVFAALQRTGGTIAGDAYQSLRSRLDRAMRASRNDPQLSQALQGMREAFDGAMERSISQADRAAWRQARREYRNMLVIEKAATGAGSNAAEGLISPSQLRNAVVQQNRRGYARGRGDFADLARAGEAVMKPLPQSGTAPRAAASGALSVLSAIGGHAAAGPYGAAGAVAAPAIAARTIMSGPVQRYLANQLLADVQNNVRLRGPVNALMAPSAIALQPEYQP